MTINYSLQGKVLFYMVHYFGNIIDDTLEGMKRELETLATNQLFDVAEDATKLCRVDTELIHRFVAQLLYLSECKRPEIQLAVSFLCTLVKDPDTYYYKKLSSLMNYIQVTIGIPFISSIDKSVKNKVVR